MRTVFARAVSSLVILCMLSACASSMTLQPLKAQSTNDMRALPVKANKVYVVRFTDGTEQEVEGSTIVAEEESLCIYSPRDEKWTRYPKASINEIYQKDVDQQKKSNRSALITGAAVLAAFLGVSAGGYFIQKELR